MNATNALHTRGGDELRARWACAELAEHGITAEPIYDTTIGAYTGAVAVDPEQLLATLGDLDAVGEDD